MADSVGIRAAGPDDIAELIGIDTVVPHDAARAADIARWVAAGFCFAATAEGRIVGYGVLHHHFYGQAMLELVMVGMSRRRQGIGRSLIQHAITSCGSPRLWTSTNRSNTAMRHLLASLSFVPSGQIDGLDEGDPELVFRLDHP